MVRHVRKRIYKGYYIVVFVLTLLALLFIELTFRVEEMHVRGTDDVKGLGRYHDKLIFTINESSMEEYLMEQNPALSQVRVQKILPNTIEVRATTLLPIADLSIRDGFLRLLPEGRILLKQRERNESGNIVLINIYQPLYYHQFASGDVIDNSEVLAALYFIDRVQDLGVELQAVDIRNENMIVLMGGDHEYFVSSVKDVGIQYEELRLMLEHVSVGTLDYSSIDVRFERPVIKFR